MIILWFKLWFGVWLKLWPKIEESSMISLRDGGLVAAFFWCARGDPGSRARPGPRDPGPGPGRGPRAHQKMQPPTHHLSLCEGGSTKVEKIGWVVKVEKIGSYNLVGKVEKIQHMGLEAKVEKTKSKKQPKSKK